MHPRSGGTGENTPFAKQSKEREQDKGQDNTLTPSVPTSIPKMLTFVTKESNCIKFFLPMTQRTLQTELLVAKFSICQATFQVHVLCCSNIWAKILLLIFHLFQCLNQDCKSHPKVTLSPNLAKNCQYCLSPFHIVAISTKI